jgi:hypothetical protein
MAKIQLVTNPTTDTEFRRAAEVYLASRADSPGQLQTRLRANYPNVVVVRGIEDTGSERWYVYREGRWQSSETKPEGGSGAAIRRRGSQTSRRE